MSETLSRSMDLPSIQARLHPNLPLVGRRLLFYEHPTTALNDELCQSSPPTRPGENTRSSQALTRLNGIHISFVWSRREGNWTVTLLLHYITEKAILVMSDPRPTIVPGEPGLLSLPSEENDRGGRRPARPPGESARRSARPPGESARRSARPQAGCKSG